MANIPFVIKWFRLRDIDKHYERAIAHFPHDPLEAKAAVVDGKIVGVYWTSTKGYYTQMLFGNGDNPISGPYEEKNAATHVEFEWLKHLQGVVNEAS